MIHTTIGIYPNGEYKVNGVISENLPSHIEYNKTYRFGRALVVDGNIVYKGSLPIERIEQILSKIDFVATEDTAPYH